MEESRASTLALGLLLGGGGGLAAFMGGTGMAALGNGAATVTVSFGDAVVLPAGLAMLILGAGLLARSGPAAQRRIFIAALTAMAGTLLLPPILWLGAGAYLPAQGYRQCERPAVGARFTRIDWVRRGTVCPGDVARAAARR